MLNVLSKNIFLVIFLLSLTIKTHGLIVKEQSFRLGYYVYYQILYKIMNIPISEFENVTVISENPNILVFEYGADQYTATVIGKGAVFVDMPGDISDRYLMRKKAPTLILSQYEY